jgi:hypothetical protein
MIGKYPTKGDSGQQYFQHMGKLPEKTKVYQIHKEPEQLTLFNIEDITQPRLFKK